MRKSLIALLLSFGVSAAMAATTAAPASTASGAAPKALSSSQNRMSVCSKAAKGLKGDAYKASVKSCLTSHPASGVAVAAPASAISLKK